MLMNCVRQSPDALFGDDQALDRGKVAEIAKESKKWKSLRPSERC